jgi:hypothetical protein
MECDWPRGVNGDATGRGVVTTADASSSSGPIRPLVLTPHGMALDAAPSFPVPADSARQMQNVNPVVATVVPVYRWGCEQVPRTNQPVPVDHPAWFKLTKRDAWNHKVRFTEDDRRPVEIRVHVFTRRKTWQEVSVTYVERKRIVPWFLYTRDVLYVLLQPERLPSESG